MYIRSFDQKDSPSVKELVTSIMGHEYPQEQKAYQYNDLDIISEAYGKIREQFLIAEEGSAIVGTAGIKEDNCDFDSSTTKSKGKS